MDQVHSGPCYLNCQYMARSCKNTIYSFFINIRSQPHQSIRPGRPSPRVKVQPSVLSSEPVRTSLTWATSVNKSIAIIISNELNFGSKPTVKFSNNFSIESNNQTKTALTQQQVKGMLTMCLNVSN